MANLLVILAAIWAAVMKAQQVTHLWTVQRGGSGSDRAYALQVDASGNAFVAGYTASTDLGSQSNAGDFDMFVMKLDSLGAHQWTILRGGSSVEEARGLQVDASGNVFVAGYTASTDLDSQSNAGDFDVFVMKFDSDGAHQWTILRGGSGDDFAYGLQVDASGNAFVAGYTASTDLDNQSNAGDFDVFVMKFDSDGAHQWTILRGGPGDEFAYGLQVDASVNVFVAGTMDSQFHPNDTDVFVTKVDRDGAHQWTILRGGSSYDYPQCLQVDASGNVFVAGFTASTDLDSQSNAGNTDVFVMKFDSDGAHQWTILRGGPGDEFAYGLQVDASGNVFVAGYTDSDLDSQSNAGGYDVFVMKLDSLGAHQWTILRGDSGDDFANGLQVDASGNVFVAGETQNSLDGNTNAGSWDITVMKFQVPTTTVTTTSRTLALSTTVTEATTTTTTVAHSSTQTSTTLRMERLLPADTQAMASSSAVMLDQMKLTQQATIDQQQSFDSQTSSGPVFGVKLDAVPDDPVVLRNSNASNTSPLIVSFPAHCDDTGSAAAWLVASEIADALSNRLPTQAVGETVPAEYRSKVVDVSVLKEMQGSISVAEINCGSPIAIRLSASKPSAGDRCLWFDFAQQKWSQAGTEVLEELELRVMYPDTDLPWDGTWCRTTHLSTFVLAAAPGVDVLMIVLISIGPIIVFATMVLTCCIVRRKRKQRQEREEKEAFLRVEGESYDRYRHSMFAIVRTAVDDGAKGVLILGMKSAIHEKPARWKLLQEDLYKAHLKKKAPFVDFGERLIDFSNIQFQQVTKEALSETLAHETAGRTFAIVAMCLEADTGYVEHDVRHHNKIKKDTQGTAKRILPFFHKAKQQRSKLAGLQVEMPKNTGVRAHTWFSFYRDTVLDIIMTCIDEGATGLTIFGIQPHIGGENTYLEWPALEEDVTHAYNHRLYPFDSTAVPDPTFKRVKPEDLRTRIKAETRRGAFVIIASCSDHHAPYAKQIIREFNASSGQCGKAMRAWATANDMYQTKGEQAAEQDHGHGHHSNQPSNQGPTATVPEEESFVVKEQPDGRSKCVEDRIALGEDGEVDKDTWNVLHDANEEDSDPDAFRI